MAGVTDTSKRISLRNQSFMDTGPNTTTKSNKFAVQLRKDKRMSLLTKKRQKFLSPKDNSNGHFPNELFDIFPILSSSPNITSTFITLFDFIIIPQDNNILLLILKGINALLISENRDSIHFSLTQEHINALITLMDNTDENFIEISIDIGTNLIWLSNSYAEIFVRMGCWQCIYRNTIAKAEKVRLSSLWLLANLSGSSQDLRKRLINYGSFDFLIEFLNLQNPSQKIVDAALWAMSNLSKNINTLDEDKFEALITLLKKYHRTQKKFTIKSSLLIIYNLIYKNDIFIKAFLKSGIIPEILPHTKSNDSKTIYYCLKIFNIIISSNDNNNTQVLMNLNIIEILRELIDHHNDYIREEVYFCFSNIVAGTETQRQVFIQDFSLTKSLKGFIDCKVEVQNETSHLFLNLSKLCTSDDVEMFYHMGILTRMSEEIKNEHCDAFFNTILEAIYNFLMKISERLMEKIYEENFFGPIEEMMINNRTADKALRILQKFLPDKFISIDQPEYFEFS
ncbi:hypothetical protein SteCoe_18713 [Stentor coeruleus]|uniref:Importin subunit alpha n=1 Tax=Stentor coeruleus TaxID=5963 RepID=A0A1R2BVY2_9CILI|nr:hypothetical protein SteCoe_18713 [Stentor coeruleus]